MLPCLQIACKFDVERDHYFADVVALLHLNGSNGGTSFTDNAVPAQTYTANGNAQTSTAQSKFNGSSMLLDGTTDWLSVANFAGIKLGSKSFCIEAWIYKAAEARVRYLAATENDGLANGGFEFGLNSSEQLFFSGYGGGSGQAATQSSGTIGNSAWVHVCAEHNEAGAGLYLFANGAQVGLNSSFTTTVADTTTPMYIGHHAGGGGYTSRDFNGHIAEFRLTKNRNRYATRPFLPAAPFPNF